MRYGSLFLLQSIGLISVLTGCSIDFRAVGTLGTSALPSITWNSVGPTQWSSFQTHLQALKASSQATPTFSTVTIPFGNHLSDGFVMAPSGVLYALPYSGGTTVMKFNPSTGVISQFGAVSGWYPGGVLALNGKIYAFPERASSDMIELDPATDTIRLIPTPAVTTPCGGNAKWAGTAVAPNGKVYGIPACADHVVEYNPATDTATLVGQDYTGCFYCWTRASLAPNGKIYGTPNVQANGQAIEVDPATSNTSLFASLGSAVRTCGSALGFDGMLYGFPCAGTTSDIRRINPTLGTNTVAVTVASTPAIWSGSAASNGKIYAHDGAVAGSVLEFDPTDNSYQEYAGAAPANAYSEGGMMGPDGKLYFAPLNGDKIFVVDAHPGFTPDINLLLSPYLNGAH